MRILIVAPEFPPQVGGMETHAFETARGLARRGHPVLVLTSSRPRRNQPPAEVEVRPCLNRDFGGSLRRICKAVRTFDASVLLLMNAGFAPVARRLVGAAPPVVVRTAGNDAYGAWYGPRHPLRFLFWRLPHTDPASLGARLRRSDQDHRVAEVLSSLRMCTRVLCNSSYTRARLRNVGVPDDLLHLLIGGVDTSAFNPEGTGHMAIGARRQVIGIVGHLLPIKGMRVALQALALLGASGGDILLRIAGSGPEEAALRALADRLGLLPRLDLLGSVPPEDMPAFYRGLDLYLQPSVEIGHPASDVMQTETMGRALIEAAACGIPAVASRIGGIPDVVRDGSTGVLVPPGDPQALAATVSRLLVSHEERRRMGEAARRLAVESFSWEVVVQATEVHLLAALGAPGPTPEPG